jgi:hypothetical protein
MPRAAIPPHHAVSKPLLLTGSHVCLGVQFVIGIRILNYFVHVYDEVIGEHRQNERVMCPTAVTICENHERKSEHEGEQTLLVEDWTIREVGGGLWACERHYYFLAILALVL